jgi:glycerophosphoryl diester phosphodiesterase
MRSSRSAADDAETLFAGAAGFAHRGLHGALCENSLASFDAAIAVGAGIECDLRLSRDGVPVVFHDSSLERLCGASVECESLDASALVQFRLGGSEQRIPRLADMLALVDGRAPVLLELKRRARPAASPIEELCSATLAAVRAYRGPVGVMSFDPRAPAWFARHAPDIRRGLVIGDRLSPVARWGAMTLARPDFLSVHRGVLAQPWVVRARRAMTVTSWTIRTRAERDEATRHADALIWESDGRP